MFVLLIVICVLQAHRTHSFLHIPSPKAVLGGMRVPTVEKRCRLIRNDQHLSLKCGNWASGSSIPTLRNSMKDIPAWDKFGRVPYDDWLFTTSRLTDPNLFKRSFVEAVNQEMPIVMASFGRRTEVVSGITFLLYATSIVLVGMYVYRVAMAVKSSPGTIQVREDAIRGFRSAIGVYRKLTDAGADGDDDGASSRGKSRNRGGGSGRRGRDYDADDDDDSPLAAYDFDD